MKISLYKTNPSAILNQQTHKHNKIETLWKTRPPARTIDKKLKAILVNNLENKPILWLRYKFGDCVVGERLYSCGNTRAE